jgi:transposase
MTELPTTIEDFRSLIEDLLAEIASLKAENLELKAENAELRRQLGQASHNSHKPPSSDLYKQGKRKKLKPGLAKKKAKGGQEGHEGKTLEQLKPDKVNTFIMHKPKACGCCGRQFTDSELRLHSKRQVFDLPQAGMEVLEHQVYSGYCCAEKHKAEFPAEVNHHVQYGPKVKAWITMLSVAYRMPIQNISQLFSELYGYAINSSTILSHLQKGYDLLEASESEIRSRLQTSAVVHYDETSLQISDKRRWLHTASSEEDTYLFIHDKRGREALESDASLIKDFTGTAVHDCYASYFGFDCNHALCGAHLLRELTALIETGCAWAKQMHGYLRGLYLYKKRTGKVIKKGQQAFVMQRFEAILKAADEEEPPPKSYQR